jgi:hypothetical protein
VAATKRGGEGVMVTFPGHGVHKSLKGTDLRARAG